MTEDNVALKADIERSIKALEAVLETCTTSTPGRSIYQHQLELMRRIRDIRAPQWVPVAILDEYGTHELEDAEYPPIGEEVLVLCRSALGFSRTLHTIPGELGSGNWSWPSFGVAWMRIPEPPHD